MELNKRQKSLLIQILSKEWEKASMLVFNCSIQDIKERSNIYFSEEWSNARQNVIDIEDLIDDKKSKKFILKLLKNLLLFKQRRIITKLWIISNLYFENNLHDAATPEDYSKMEYIILSVLRYIYFTSTTQEQWPRATNF